MKNLFDTLKQKQRDLHDVRSVCVRLEEEVKALQTAARLLSEGEESQPDDSKNPSQVHMVRAVLQEKGSPMHMSEIAEAVKKKFGKKLDATVMTAVVYRYASRHKTFFKAKDKPNTWGLLEWQIADNSELPVQPKAVSA